MPHNFYNKRTFGYRLVNNFDDSDTCGGNRLVLSISTSLDGTVVEVQLLYGTLRECGSKLRYI
ncbi:hypothetical protein [Nostoc sp. C110]|uniref:hypothetical protein n=1 Tax=Nostoc sp. C110 TaxID=3349876 RepID=UPI00370DAE12